jgi:hypothetical protein
LFSPQTDPLGFDAKLDIFKTLKNLCTISKYLIET